ncbi:MAG: adenylate/guanylate cyclase domain-containing protein [Acidimicrobiia bacterium]
MADVSEEGTGGEVKARKGRRTSLATRLAVVILLVSISAMLVTAILSSSSVGASSDDLVEQRVSSRAGAIASELNDYFSTAERNVEVLSLSRSLPVALKALSAGFTELDAIDPDTLSDEAERLFAYYDDEFIPALEAVRGTAVDPDSVLPESDPAAIYLQTAYIADPDVDEEDRRLITDPGDGSSWTAAHKVYHPAIRNQVDILGFDDLFIVDASSGAVVYSTNKDIAFGTNMVSGPHSGSPLAALSRVLLSSREPGVVELTDFATYTPLLDLPSGFLGAPIFEGDDIIGAVIVSIDLDEVTEITTQAWREGRFGETGESYLVGSDRTMRTDSRFFLETPEAYLLRVNELGSVAPEDEQRIEALGTTVVFQPVDNASVRAALEGSTGIEEVRNYLGAEVYSAHVPIATDTLGWALMVEQGVDEANAPFSDYLRSILTITVVFVVGLTFVAVAWAGNLVSPLRSMGAALQATREGEGVTKVPVVGVAEFRDLAEHLNDMVNSLVLRREAALRALRGKTAVLRTLLPASTISQVSVGDRQFVETVPQATVAVIRMGGIDALFTDGDIDANREFLTSLIEQADGVARANDLERVKVTGSSYFAVSGLDTPHLDHAPRSVRFAAQAMQAMKAVAAEAGIELEISAGVASGTVTAGLVGESRLVFDLWGAPVDTAAKLAQLAPDDGIYVSSDVRKRMPGGTDLREVALPHDETAWSLVAEQAVSGGSS